jgi:hypothetical protein
MICVRRQRPRRVLAAVLAVAVLHQLGACPCGCLERNLWWQSFLQLTGQATNRVVVVSPKTTAVEVVAAPTCDDDHEPVMYLVSPIAKVSASHLGQFGAFPVVASYAVISDAVGLSSTLSHQVDCRTLCTPAHTLRAQLQVFLI